jgi:hypothetical protein
MRSLIKTVLVAAIGAAVVTASPAFAAKAKRAQVQPVYGQEYSVAAPQWNSGDWQIRAEYLKDAPIHNGNNY